ncbi:MAG: hypothetical protein KDC48_16230, partial [Planctomycetes bacterium]|nr:hypothetical protein [Planctomycetota bacterium]
GGQTWVDITPQFFGLGNLEWYGSAKLTDQRGWLVGKVVMQTTDAGATWSQVLGPVGIGQNLDVSFADASTGWVVGEFGRIFKTGDGGLTWQQQNAGLTTSVTSVSAVNRQVAWIADADGRTMRTQDGGATWLLDSATDVGGGIFAIHMRSEDRGWVVGHPLSGLSAPGGNIYQRRPGTPLDLTFADLRAGATAELRAHGTAPNEIVLFAFSDDPLPTGGCASAAPFCVDLAAPLNILGLSLGGTDGSALLSLPIPATLVTGQVRVQCAALRAGALVTSNAVTRSLVGN